MKQQREEYKRQRKLQELTIATQQSQSQGAAQSQISAEAASQISQISAVTTMMGGRNKQANQRAGA